MNPLITATILLAMICSARADNGESSNLSIVVVCHTGTVVEVYLTNQGKTELPGIIQSAARCILELNGRYYAIQDLGGKTSYMPPGKTFGPLSIDITRFSQIQSLTPTCFVDTKAPHPEFMKGANKLRVHFKVLRGTQDALISSGEVEIER